MGHLNPAAIWGVPLYVERKAGLPDMGKSPLGPVGLTNADTDAILACKDTAAVAELKAYAGSYVGPGGAAWVSTIATVAFGLSGKRSMTAVSAVSALLGGSVVLEARRRARQWEAIADARLQAGPTDS